MNIHILTTSAYIELLKIALGAQAHTFDAARPADAYITAELPMAAPSPAAPMYLVVSTHPLVSDCEAFVYGGKPVSTVIPTAVWMTDNIDASYTQYLRTVYKCPVTRIPYLIAEPAAVAPLAVASSDAPFDIILFDTNTSFNTSIWKQLQIANECYRLDAQRVNRVHVYNFPSAPTAHAMLSELDIAKAGKVIVSAGAFQLAEARPASTVFLTNQLYDDVDPVVYTLLANGYRLFHTSPRLAQLGFGTRYDTCAIRSAAAAILAAVRDGGGATATDRVIAYCKKHNPRLVTIDPFNVTTSAPQTSLTSKHLHVDDLSTPLIVCYDNNVAKITDFKDSIERNGWEYMYVGNGETWTGHRSRMLGLRNLLRTLPANKQVVVSDTRDVFCCRSPYAFMEAVATFPTRFIVSMETLCEGRFEREDTPERWQCRPLTSYWKHHGVSGRLPLRKFANCGLMTAPAGEMLTYFEWTIENNFKDDQYSLCSYMIAYPERVSADVDAQILHTTNFGVNAGVQDVRIQNQDSPTLAELFGRSAFFLHLPGRHLGGVGVIYASVKTLLDCGASDALLRSPYKDHPEPSWAYTMLT